MSVPKAVQEYQLCYDLWVHLKLSKNTNSVMSAPKAVKEYQLCYECT